MIIETQTLNFGRIHHAVALGNFIDDLKRRQLVYIYKLVQVLQGSGMGRETGTENTTVIVWPVHADWHGCSIVSSVGCEDVADVWRN
ncbi:MAG: hypothetical protein CMP98_05640 [Gammaproteobacteria bacterium]|nr:hypothetical protein [Gammaproteobacteria bacterium]OUU10171.1 MAG: hypothetical protein CBB94_05800 [Gammaproteobacteria bacterium TMED34]